MTTMKRTRRCRSTQRGQRCVMILGHDGAHSGGALASGWRNEVRLLTNSRLKTARTCLRLHRLRYEDGWRLRSDAAPLRFGTLMHGALEAWERAQNAHADTRLALALAACAAEPDDYERVKAEALMVGYHARWIDAGLRYVAVEVQFKTRLTNPESGRSSPGWRLAGKLDAVVLDANGRTLLMEHKTCSEDLSPGCDYLTRLRLDTQISIYWAGARTLGHQVQGCLYDVIRKPGLRPLMATPVESRKYRADGALYASQRSCDESSAQYRARLLEDIAARPDSYYVRAEVTRLEDELREHQAETWQTVESLTRDLRDGRAARNPEACRQYGRLCAFFEHCSTGRPLSEDPRFTRSFDPHPELSEPGQEAA